MWLGFPDRCVFAELATSAAGGGGFVLGGMVIPLTVDSDSYTPTNLQDAGLQFVDGQLDPVPSGSRVNFRLDPGKPLIFSNWTCPVQMSALREEMPSVYSAYVLYERPILLVC